MTRKAPVRLTGGAGFRLEDQVAARFLLDLLGGSNSLDAQFGRVVQIDWQARDAGWLADDLALSCVGPDGDRGVGLSIKSDRQVTSAGFPEEFVDTAWRQWLGQGTSRTLREGLDVVALATGQLAGDVEEAWAALAIEALQTTPERMLARLAPAVADEGSQSSEIQRRIFNSLRCPASLQGLGDTGDIATVRLLRQVRLLHFDFQSPTSRDHANALADCRQVLRSGDASEAATLWDRLVAVAAEKRVAGGSIDLAGILAALRGQFELRDHPDYRRDWEVLDRHSRDEMGDVRTEVAGLPRLTRDDEESRIRARLEVGGVCFAAGESGSGKSALAKEVAGRHYSKTVWLDARALDFDGFAQMEQGLGLRHPLVEVLRSAPRHCLVVLDGAEGYPERAIRLAGQLIRDLRAAPTSAHVQVLLTAQAESAGRVVARLAEHEVPLPLLQITPVGRPDIHEVQGLLMGVADLRWIALRQELWPLLTNLKVLDWVVRAVRIGAILEHGPVVGLTGLIDRLWARWAEGGAGDRLARSHLLMQLAALEAETLDAGVARTRLGFAEQGVLPELVQDDLVRVRDERVRFSHDLPGDWARLRVLVAEGGLAGATGRRFVESVRWHRAVRLFGQRLLEQSGQGCEQWGGQVAALEVGSQADQLLRDLLLESVFVATNARSLLEQVWPALVADEGRLLNRLLDRFLIVATVPDPRLPEFTDTPESVVRLEHAFRVPFWPYWGPVLTVLQLNAADVARLAPLTGARVCGLWLQKMPVEVGPGRPTPWRREAAALALSIAREIQALEEERVAVPEEVGKSAFEALLYAAPDLPDAVESLCLELAKRRDPAPEVQARADRARQAEEADRRRWQEANPERAREWNLLSTPIEMGPLREAWPDGPRQRVDQDFESACLDSSAFPTFARVRPDAAREVLLAVCIEEPRRENPFGGSTQGEFGLQHWQEGYPPLWFRGPFLQFLRDAPDHGLAFVLRLVNFASRRFAVTEPRRLAPIGMSGGAELAINVKVDGQSRRWFGDHRTLRWHHEWTCESLVVKCALMAVEKWLYDNLDGGENIEPWVARILRESESLAFAGLLLDVGKRRPDLLTGVLRPLLGVWELYELDVDSVLQRRTMNAGLIGWDREPERLRALAHEWYGQGHHSRRMLDIAIGFMLSHPEMTGFFSERRSEWGKLVDERGQPEGLRLLIERLNPQNHTRKTREDGSVVYEFEWPEDVRRQNEVELRRQSDEAELSIFPFQCRQRLDAGTRLQDAELLPFWETLQRIERSAEDTARPVLCTVEDALCAGIAVLLVLHRDWLETSPERMIWCRSRLQAVLERPPRLSAFEDSANLGWHWDSSIAECGIVMLAADRADQLARLLVGRSVTAYRYATAALTMQHGFGCRERLAEDFDRMMNLAVRTAGLRSLFARASQLQSEAEAAPILECLEGLIHQFVGGSLRTDIPALQEEDQATLAEFEELNARLVPEWEGRSRRRRRRRRGRAEQKRPRPRLPGLDLFALRSAFAWLDVAATGTVQRPAEWLGFVRELHQFALSLVPREDPMRQDVDGLPSEFDDWVYGLVATAVARMGPAEGPDSLWRPVLELGTGAHRWVERFFWHWFIEGVQSAESPQSFAERWTEMIKFALFHPGWDPAGCTSFDLDEMVRELLGFHFGMTSVADDARFTEPLGRMVGVFEQAASRWLASPRVASSFARFLVRPAAARLLVPGVRWLHNAVRTFDDYDWTRDSQLEASLVEVLHTSWERERNTLSNDTPARDSFSGLLTILCARGSHAATVFRDRVLDSGGHR